MITRPEPRTRTAIVTGASQGIGAGLVTRFLEMVYNVAGNSRTISDSTNLTPSPRLALVDGDIGDCATAQKITDTAIGRFGRIDVLVNNAGLLLAKPFIDYTAGDFEAYVLQTGSIISGNSSNKKYQTDRRSLASAYIRGR